MAPIVESAALAAFCARVSRSSYVTVDTEFMRDKTYYPQLCLVQVAGDEDAAVIDALAPGIDLSPLLALMDNPAVLKVFHAARQDLEIFHNLTGRVPAPLFDTQVAAMVCGFGEQVSYENLAAQLSRARIDKSVRFTDWAARPLSERQISYALSDVTHLRPAYEALARKLATSGRAHWLAEEMAILMDPGTYRIDPDEVWRRLKPRGAKPRFLAVLKEACAWREREAQRRDTPRNRVVRDETILDVAAHTPATLEDLARMRGINRGFAEGRLGQELLEAVKRGLAVPAAEAPSLPDQHDLPPGLGPIVELLKVLLKMKCEEHGVAQKLVATTAELERIAADDGDDIPALNGWRREVFGEAAIDLKAGRLGFTLKGKRIVLMRLDGAAKA
ncbi:MAG: ribonuclease D [Azospirillum sp.]|nr:ribonuclease D [Azospirillum sp.]MCZ8124090.1 ribonuclease D [Magnetospirillum sp.]